MGGELHEGVAAFQPLSPGREAVMLGRVQVGEISPTVNPAGRFPGASGTFRPTRSPLRENDAFWLGLPSD